MSGLAPLPCRFFTSSSGWINRALGIAEAWDCAATADNITPPEIRNPATRRTAKLLPFMMTFLLNSCAPQALPGQMRPGLHVHGRTYARVGADAFVRPATLSEAKGSTFCNRTRKNTLPEPALSNHSSTFTP